MDEDQTTPGATGVDINALPRDTHNEFPQTGMSFESLLTGSDDGSFEDAMASLDAGDDDQADDAAGADEGDDQVEDAEEGDGQADANESADGDEASSDDADGDDADGDGTDDATAAEARETEIRTAAERDLVARFTQAFPDVGAQTPEELVAAFREERQANDVVVDVLEREPTVAAFMRELAGGRSLVEAVRLAFAGQMQQPDRDEDPEGYDAWVRAEALREHQETQQRAEREAADQETQRYADAARASIQALATENGWDAPTARRVGEQILAFMDSPPPEQLAPVIWRGLNHERLMADAERAAAEREAAAELRGRNAGIESVKGKGKTPPGQGPRRFSAPSGTTKGDAASGEHAAMAKRFERSSDPLRSVLRPG